MLSRFDARRLPGILWSASRTWSTRRAEPTLSSRQPRIVDSQWNGTVGGHDPSVVPNTFYTNSRFEQ